MAGRVCAVIVAGGSGTRFGNPHGKQLIDICGRPMVAWTASAFDRATSIGHIVIVCPAEHQGEFRAAIESFAFDTPVSFAPAGETRQLSTRSGLNAVPAELPLVAIHDGARPLITPDAIDGAVASLEADPSLAGVVCAQPAIDTLKEVASDGTVVGTPDRSRFWCVQTPQVFPVSVLRAALDRADAEGFTGTDDASVVERAGGRVRCVESPRDNMKVTVPEDLVPVTAMLRERIARG